MNVFIFLRFFQSSDGVAHDISKRVIPPPTSFA